MATATTKHTVCAYCRTYGPCTPHGHRYLCVPCARAQVGP